MQNTIKIEPTKQLMEEACKYPLCDENTNPDGECVGPDECYQLMRRNYAEDLFKYIKKEIEKLKQPREIVFDWQTFNSTTACKLGKLFIEIVETNSGFTLEIRLGKNSHDNGICIAYVICESLDEAKTAAEKYVTELVEGVFGK